jgi:hypothetical protein
MITIPPEAPKGVRTPHVTIPRRAPKGIGTSRITIPRGAPRHIETSRIGFAQPTPKPDHLRISVKQGDVSKRRPGRFCRPRRGTGAGAEIELRLRLEVAIQLRRMAERAGHCGKRSRQADRGVGFRDGFGIGISRRTRTSRPPISRAERPRGRR